MKIKEFFPKGYYLNLDRRTDRRELFEEEMLKVGLEGFFERISAEDGISEPDALLRHHYCAYTYYKLFEKIYKEEYEYVLIFEDDAFFYNEWHKPGIELVEDALDELQNFPDWDLVYFGGCPLTPITPVSTTLCTVHDILNTHAVGYKRSAIKFVLDNYVPFRDSFIDRWYGAHASLKKYLINPIAVPQRTISSDLDSHGHQANMKTYFQCYENALKAHTNNETGS